MTLRGWSRPLPEFIVNAISDGQLKVIPEGTTLDFK